MGRSCIVGGANYGQGSSREHAALVPLYLGVRAVIAQSFARIHAANLINAGILPLTFERPEDYEKLAQGSTLIFTGLHAGVPTGRITAAIEGTDEKISFLCQLTERQISILRCGGLLNYTREAGK